MRETGIAALPLFDNPSGRKTGICARVENDSIAFRYTAKVGSVPIINTADNIAANHIQHGRAAVDVGTDNAVSSWACMDGIGRV